MKYAALTIAEKAKSFGVEELWEFLGNRASQIFGEESASAAVWMFLCLVVRYITFILGLHRLGISNGIIFASPYFIQVHLFYKIIEQSIIDVHSWHLDICHLCGKVSLCYR